MSTKAAKISRIPGSDILDKSQAKSQGITYRTIGTTLQALAVQLDDGEKIYSEVGKMSWMTDNIKLNTKGQGLGKMLSRTFASESLFINEFSCEAGTGIVTFSTDQAGKIIPVDLNTDASGIIFQKGAYLCSEKDVDRSTILMKKIATGLFGGKGFIMQKLSGKGRAHLIADGEVVMYDLKKDDTILVDQGNLVAYDETVDFDIRTVGGGIKNWLFGGEGLFLGVMKGPGKVWMQTRKKRLTNTQNQYANRGTTAAKNPLGCVISSIVSLGFLAILIAITIISELA